MSTALPSQLFALTPEQAQQLISSIQVYRRLAWESQLPSLHRNEVLRLLQAVQGKLMSVKEQRALSLTGEETGTLQGMVKELLKLYSRQPEDQWRNRRLADLTQLHASLARPVIVGIARGEATG